MFYIVERLVLLVLPVSLEGGGGGQIIESQKNCGI